MAKVGRALEIVKGNVDDRAATAPDVTQRIETELASLHKQRGNLVRLAAHAGEDIPELGKQLGDLKERIRSLETELRSTAQAPTTVEGWRGYEKEVQADAVFRAEPDALRDTLRAAFPDGLLFKPAENGNRRVWAVSGRLRLAGSRLESDPTGGHQLGKQGAHLPACLPPRRAAPLYIDRGACEAPVNLRTSSRFSHVIRPTSTASRPRSRTARLNQVNHATSRPRNPSRVSSL